MGFNLDCSYSVRGTPTEYGYNCRVENSLTVDQRNTTIETVSGTHVLKRGNNNLVECLAFDHNSNMNFIPTGYSKFFKNLKILWIANCPLQSIIKSDFEEPSKFLILGLKNTQIKLITRDVFWGFENLTQLYIQSNQVKKIHEESLSKMTKLEILNLADNNLGYLSEKLFTRNMNLQEIYLTDNKLKIIETKTFFGLTNVKKIELRRNICITKNFPLEIRTMFKLNELIEKYCENPLADEIKELSETAFNDGLVITTLQSEKRKIGEELTNKSNEIIKIQSENGDLQADIVTIKSEKGRLLIEKELLEKEIGILRLNHSSATLKLDEIFNQTEELRFDLMETNDQLNVSLVKVDELTTEVDKLNDIIEWFKGNSSLLSEVNLYLHGELSKLQETATQTYEDWSELLLANSDLETNLTLLETGNNHLQVNLQEQIKGQERIEKLLIIVSAAAIAMLLVVSVIIICRLINIKKARAYNTNESNEMEAVFCDDSINKQYE